jgi:hypothetical protein
MERASTGCWLRSIASLNAVVSTDPLWKCGGGTSHKWFKRA